MRGISQLRSPSAGLGFGAALMLASCAAPPPLAPGVKPQAGVTSVDGANVALASFQNSAFPYHGLIPNYQETGKTRPFLDVDDNGRLGHSSPRGGLLWEDQTYNDRTVLLAAPQSFDPSQAGVIIVFFHGNQATLARDVIARQQIVRQLADSGLNGVLVAPQLALDAPEFERRPVLVAGRLRRLPQRGRGQARRVLSERARRLPADAGGDRGLQRRLSAGGLFADRRGRDGPGARPRAARRALRRARQVRELGRGAGRNAFFVSAYSTSSRDGNMAIEAELQQAGLKTGDCLPATLSPGEIAFVDAGSVDHNDFVTSAWGGAPLRDIFSRMR